MQTARTEADYVQLWITVGRQPGLGGWLNVWLVARSRRAKPAKAAAAKKLPQGACTA